MILKKHLQNSPIIKDEDAGKQVEKDYCFIETEAQFRNIKNQLEAAEKIVVDIETSSVSPHTGSILGYCTYLQNPIKVFMYLLMLLINTNNGFMTI